VDGGVGRELPAPGRQDPGKTGEVRPDDTLVSGEPFEGERRGGEHGVIREALRRADAGPERLRHRAGEEEVRPGQLVVQVVGEPLLGCRLLTLGTVAVATGMMDAVVSPTAWALREAVTVMATAARLDGAAALAVCGGEGRRALQILRGQSGEDIAAGGQGSSPCMRALRRS
jgi:hypothetical protein